MSTELLEICLKLTEIRCRLGTQALEIFPHVGKQYELICGCKKHIRNLLELL